MKGVRKEPRSQSAVRLKMRCLRKTSNEIRGPDQTVKCIPEAAAVVVMTEMAKILSLMANNVTLEPMMN